MMNDLDLQRRTPLGLVGRGALTCMLACLLAGALAGCGGSDGGSASDGDTTAAHDDDHDHADGDHDHDHADGDHDHAHEGGMGDEHDHGEEVSLGTTMVGDWEIEAWQGHGELEPGKEMHLVVKLPFEDDGATSVRAWIGTENRLASIVGRGEYAPSHDDYDLHAEAPSPLPDGAKWWIEIERPDGTTAVGSIDAI